MTTERVILVILRVLLERERDRDEERELSALSMGAVPDPHHKAEVEALLAELDRVSE